MPGNCFGLLLSLSHTGNTFVSLFNCELVSLGNTVCLFSRFMFSPVSLYWLLLFEVLADFLSDKEEEEAEILWSELDVLNLNAMLAVGLVVASNYGIMIILSRNNFATVWASIFVFLFESSPWRAKDFAKTLNQEIRICCDEIVWFVGIVSLIVWLNESKISVLTLFGN